LKTVASRLNVPELPGVPKPPKLNETITIPTIDFQKLKERAPLHKRILIDNIEKLHEKIINSIEEPKFTRLEEALDEKLGELVIQSLSLSLSLSLLFLLFMEQSQ
jgi:hypothetical protein